MTMMVMMMRMILMPPPFCQSKTAVQQGGRSVEEPRLKLDEFPGGHGTSIISSGINFGAFFSSKGSKGMVCLVENLQKLQLKLLVSRL